MGAVFEGCRRCEQLREELEIERERVVQIKRAVMGPGGDSAARRLQEALGLSLVLAHMVEVLYRAYRRVLSNEYLSVAVLEDPTREGVDPTNAVRVAVVRARKIIGRDAIQTVHGMGYRLSEAGHARMKEILDGPHEPERDLAGAAAPTG